jgi:hypothetical protein
VLKREEIESIKSIIQHHWDDQKSPNPTSKIHDIPSEIHGPLVEMVELDKVENEILIDFIIAQLHARERSDQEILTLLEDIITALDKLIEP